MAQSLLDQLITLKMVLFTMSQGALSHLAMTRILLD